MDALQVGFCVIMSTCFMYASGEITTGPVHTAQLEGRRAVMTCYFNKQNADDVIEWREYVTDEFNGRTVVDDDNYDVSTSSSSSTLTFKEVTADIAGFYACRIMLEGVEANATLVVMEKLVCGTNTSEAVEGEQVEFFGYAYYYGMISSQTFSVLSQYRRVPWSGKAPYSISSFYDDRIVFNTTLTVSRDEHNKALEAKIGLTAQPEDGFDDEYSYEDSCWAKVQVLYAPDKPNLAVNGDEYKGDWPVQVNDVITCESSSRPHPQYRWQITAATDITYKSEEFTVSKSMIGTGVSFICTASNEYGSSVRELMLDVTDDGTSAASFTLPSSCVILLLLLHTLISY